jgi:hypothetical protein
MLYTFVDMTKDNIITIDLNKYCTQQQYAKETGIRLNTISQRIKRIKAGESKQALDFIEIKELNNLVLINRLTN